MEIIYNENEKIVNTIREGLKKTGGYCPCRLDHTEDNMCMCKEFREQIADPEFEGFCHCRLYYKKKQVGRTCKIILVMLTCASMTWEWIGAGVPNGLQNRFGELVASRVSSILTHSRHFFELYGG